LYLSREDQERGSGGGTVREKEDNKAKDDLR